MAYYPQVGKTISCMFNNQFKRFNRFSSLCSLKVGVKLKKSNTVKTLKRICTCGHLAPSLTSDQVNSKCCTFAHSC